MFLVPFLPVILIIISAYFIVNNAKPLVPILGKSKTITLWSIALLVPLFTAGFASDIFATGEKITILARVCMFNFGMSFHAALLTADVICRLLGAIVGIAVLAFSVFFFLKRRNNIVKRQWTFRSVGIGIIALGVLGFVYPIKYEYIPKLPPISIDISLDDYSYSEVCRDVCLELLILGFMVAVMPWLCREVPHRGTKGE